MDTEYTDTMLTVDTASILDHVVSSESDSPIEQYGGAYDNNLTLTPTNQKYNESSTNFDLTKFKTAVEEAVNKYKSGGMASRASGASRAAQSSNPIKFTDISEFSDMSD